MKKIFIQINFLPILASIFIVGLLIMPQNAEAVLGTAWGSVSSEGGLLAALNPITWVTKALGNVSILVLTIGAYFTFLSGAVLNFVTQYTVVLMADNLSSADFINKAWTAIRDVANMCFIFILLYAAIKTILGLGGETQKLIMKVIVVAILINFSLFFTKVVIDASNVLAITFYDAIAPGALSLDISRGISNSLMQPLGLQNLWKIDTIDDKQLLVIGVMGTIVTMIAAFVFFAISIMFIIRYVVLIFVIILSPLAFMGFIMPELGKYRTQWQNALLGQAFFAPIYFLLTWVVIVVAKGLPSNPENWAKIAGSAVASGAVNLPPQSSVQILVNFIIVIAFLIASLIIAKNVSNMAGPAVSGLTKWATGAAGGASFGLAGRAGRYTLGAGAEVFKESKMYKRMEAASPNSSFARLSLATIDKTRKGSFDVRGTKVGGMLGGAGLDVGNAGGQGGVEAERKAVREFLERPGTDSRKTRVERGRKADAELAITDQGNLAAAQEIDTINAVVTAAGGTPTAAQTARLAVLQPQANKLEKAISNSTTKEIEAIVESNRSLLNSQEFANRVSVQQLDAINKSDKFSEAEKDNLKNRRFGEINTAIAPGGPGAASVRANIRRLSDTELEMINPDHLGNADFVSQMQPSQIDTVNKSTKFTTSQKGALRTARRQPLRTALATGNTAHAAGNAAGFVAAVATAQTIVKGLGHKEIASLDMTDLQTPTMAETYTPELLKRMAPEMNPADVSTLRTYILATLPATHRTHTWLLSPAGIASFP